MRDNGALSQRNGHGLLFIGDPHFAGNPPGQRQEGYCEQIIDKVRACLEHAQSQQLVPVFLGDMFHWPRDNPNHLLVDLIALFGPYNPVALVGNHDKHQSRLTSDCTISVLEAAGVITLIKESGPAFRLVTPEQNVLVGGTPDGFFVPEQFEREKQDETVIWLTHHNVDFPDYPELAVKRREIPGVDWVVNGHIHRPQETQRKGGTTWANPGNITRLVFSQRAMERKPKASIWRPGCEDLELWTVPHLDFYSVFPDQEFPQEAHDPETGESRFLKGLERLRWKKTQEGTGLKQFLKSNLNPEQPESALIWELYEEVTGNER